MGDRSSGWTLEQEAAAGAIGGHAGTHQGLGLATGDTLGGTVDALHEEVEEPAANRDGSGSTDVGEPLPVDPRA